MYKCKHFKIKELVPPFMLETLHEDVLWSMFDEDLLRGIDWLRDKFGPTTINGGSYTQSGLRTKGSSHYSEGSMHSVGKAADLKFKEHSPADVRLKLKLMESVPFISRVENGTDTWLHVDTKPTDQGRLYFFNP